LRIRCGRRVRSKERNPVPQGSFPKKKKRVGPSAGKREGWERIKVGGKNKVWEQRAQVYKGWHRSSKFSVASSGTCREAERNETGLLGRNRNKKFQSHEIPP